MVDYKMTPEDYKKKYYEEKDAWLHKRAEAAVSRNEHLPINKFTQEHLDKVEALFKQLKERQHVNGKRK